MSREISPLWLKAEAGAGDVRRFPLPWPFRLRLATGGFAFPLELIWESEPAAEVVALRFLGVGGKVLGSAQVTGPLTAVFLPRRTAMIEAHPATGLKLGLFPRSKIGLKLHAFFTGSFRPQPLHHRWKAAGAAARDLRGVHATVMEGSGAGGHEHGVRYRRYRKLFVEDFSKIPPPRPDLHLSFLSLLKGSVADAAARLAALDAQIDQEWTWIAALPPEAPTALAEWARETLARHPRAGLVEGGIDALNAALDGVEDGLVAYLPPTGKPTRDAVAMLRSAFQAHPDCRVAYTDEERCDAEGVPLSGIFKPAFNRHLLRAGDYMGDIVAIRAAYLKDLGGLRPGLGTAARYDLLLRALETLPPTGVRHIPRVAFTSHDRRAPEPLEAARALEDALGLTVDIGSDGRLNARPVLPEPAPLVSFVIPTRDRAELMGMALRSIIAKTGYRNFEIVIVDNGSVQPETFALFEETKAAWPDTVVVRDNGDFNYPRICNAGVDAARGSLICLLNNDIEVVDGGWLEEMVALVQQPRTGIVGAKLLFPDRTVQHAGVIVGLFRYAAHWFSRAAPDAPGPFGRLVSRTNVSAVTGACLMIRRSCWDHIGPLDAERFAEDCNDIDLCLRARRAGFEVVWTPFACLIHHESASRGRRRSKSHRNRLKAQRKRMEDLWGTQDFVDPHYNPNLSRTSLHAGLAKAPEGSRAPRTDEV